MLCSSLGRVDTVTVKRRLLVPVVFILWGMRVAFCAAPWFESDGHEKIISRPLPPEYRIHPDGSVTLRICFNWSCSSRETLTFTAEDLSVVTQQMAYCGGKALYDRLQRIRIGIWQMELLAQKYQPLLAKDRAINDQDQNVQGRTDCVDNSSNTTTFLHILQDFSALPGWSVRPPQVRDLFLLSQVHWTAVVADQKSGKQWSVDSWYRPHGHLPFVLPLLDWQDGKKGWKFPFDKLNPYPRFINELCEPGEVGEKFTPFENHDAGHEPSKIMRTEVSRFR